MIWNRIWPSRGPHPALLPGLFALASSVFSYTSLHALDARRVGGSEGPDSTEHSPLVAPNQTCTVRFDRATAVVDENVPHLLLFVVMEPVQCYTGSSLVVLEHTPYGGATHPGDYRFVRADISFEDNADGTEAFSVYPVDDGIAESGEGLYVRFKTLPSGVTRASTDTLVDIELRDPGGTDNRTPSAPQSLAATPGNERVTLRWSAPSDAGSTAVENYEYRYATEPGTYPATYTTVSGGSSARQVTVTQLNNGTRYKFQVRARNSVGPGAEAEVRATPTAGGGTTPLLSIADVSVNEDAGNATLTVTLSTSSSQTVTVDYATADRTASDAQDYSATSGSLTFSGTTTQQIAVSILDDSDDEGSEDFTITLSSPNNATISRGTATVTIVDDDGTAAPSLSINDASVDEDGGTATLTVTLSGTNPGTVSVDYATADGAATAGEDYEADSGTLTFSGNTEAQSITVSIIDDADNEGTEDFTVELGSADNATIDDGTGRVTIFDNDGSSTGDVPSAPRDLSANPGDGEVTLSWSAPTNDGGAEITGYEYRYAPQSDPLPDDWTAVGGSATTEVIVTGLDNGTTYRFQVRAVNADDEEGSTASATATPVEPGTGSAQRPGTPRDLSGEEGDHEVTLSWSPPESDGGSAITRYEYRFVAGANQFPAAWTRVSGGGGARQLRLGSLVNGTTYRFQVRAANRVGSGEPATTEATPVDPDATPSLGVKDVEVDENDGTAVVTVTLKPASSEAIAVDYATADGTATSGEDYRTSSGTLTFAPGTTRQTITVPVLDDARDESDETLTVTLSLSGNQDAEIGTGVALVTIRDDEGARVLTPPSQPLALIGTPGDEEVTLSWSPPEDDGGSLITHYEFRLTTDDDPYPSAWTPVFGGGQARQVRLDGLTNGTTYRFQLRAVNETGPGRPAETTATPGTGPAVAVTPQRLQINEGDSARYAIILLSEPTVTVSVRMTAELSGTDLMVEPKEVRFTTTDWSEPRMITVRSAVDSDHDDDRGILLTHRARGGGYDDADVPTVTVDVRDLRLPTILGEDADAEEGPGSTVVFNVRLSAPGGSTVTVDYATVDGTAVAGEDYRERSGRLIFLPGITQVTALVPVIEDRNHEVEETFQLELFNPVNATLEVMGERVALTGTIVDDDALIEVSFGEEAYTVDEGGDISVAVQLSRSPGRAVQIPIAVTRGRGVTNSDFSVLRSVSFNPGQTRTGITFETRQDEADEENEVVTLRLGPTLPDGVVAGIPSVAPVTIVDDDDRGVHVSTEALELQEGGSGEYTVWLNSRPTGTVTVTVEAPAGSDVSARPSRLSFTPLNWRAGQSVTVTAAADDDAVDEPAATLSHGVSGADYDGVTAGTVTVTVVEGDTPALSVTDAEAAETDGQMVFEATLDIQSSREVKVDYETVAGTATEGMDYVKPAGTVVFAPLETSARIVVSLLDDEIDEAAETFELEFTNFREAKPGGGAVSATGTILDDDLPTVRVGAITPAIAEGSLARFRFTREGDLGVRLTVPFTVTENGDFLKDEAPGSIQFTIGSEEVLLALPTEDDAMDERDGEIRLTVAKNDEYEIAGSATAMVRITDNDAPPAVIIAGARVAESAGSISFPVTLRGASAYEVTVDWLTGDLTARAGQDYQAAAGRLTFAPGETSGTIRVVVVDDLLPEEEETFSIALSGATNAVLEVASAVGTILDDDKAVTQAWLSRFGRSVASQVVEGISARLDGSGEGGALFGHAADAGTAADAGREVGLGDLLDGSSFHLSRRPLPQEASLPSGGVVSAWGRGFRTDFDGTEGDVGVDGSVLTGLAGVDFETGPVLAGVAVSYTLGDGTLTRAANGASPERSEEVESTLNSVYPYLRIKVRDRVSVWGLGGYGRGEMSFPGAGGGNEIGIRMNMGAVGARGALLNPGGAGFGVALKADAFLVRMNAVSDAGVTTVTADVNRVRLLLEGSNRVRLGTDHLVAATLEAGARHDGGDAETGVGVEAGGRLRYTNEARGLSVGGSARMMLSHEDTAFTEWGVGGALILQPQGPDRGLSLRMIASRGAATGSAADLWSPHAPGNTAAYGGRDAGLPSGPEDRLVTRVHYAMAPLGDGITMAPYAEFGLAGSSSARNSRLGWRFQIRESLRLSLETHLAPAHAAARGRGLTLRGSLIR